MKGIMIDVGLRRLFCDVDLPVRKPLNMADWRWRTTHQDAEHAAKRRVAGDILFGEFMFAFTALAMDQRYLVFFCIGVNSSAKSTCKPHDVCIVKIVIARH